MAGFSMNTEQLTSMANELNREAGVYQDQTIPKVHRLAIPAHAIPLFALGFADSYQRMYEAADAATKAMGGAVASMGAALGRVAEYYRHMEEQHGQDFDTAAAQTKAPRSGHGR